MCLSYTCGQTVSVYVLNMSNYSIHMSVHMYRHMPIHMSVRLLHNIMWINRCVCLTGQALLARYSLSTQNVSSYRPSVAARPQCGPAAACTLFLVPPGQNASYHNARKKRYLIHWLSSNGIWYTRFGSTRIKNHLPNDIES